MGGRMVPHAKRMFFFYKTKHYYFLEFLSMKDVRRELLTVRGTGEASSASNCGRNYFVLLLKL